MEAIAINGEVYSHLGTELNTDMEVISAAVNQYGSNILEIPGRFCKQMNPQDYRKLALAAVIANPEVLQSKAFLRTTKHFYVREFIT